MRYPRLALSSLLALAAIFAPSRSSATGASSFNVLDYGAVGDGAANDTAAIQRAIDACGSAHGGRVLLPSGKTFLAGALTLRDGVDFHIEGGAVLKGSPQWRDYGHPGALLFAKDAENISVSGNGTIDGNDRAIWQELANEEAGGDVNKPGWWPESFCGDWWPFDKLPGETPKTGGRPMVVIFIGCQHVRMRDITIRNASTWTVHPVGCRDVVIDSITIRNSWEVANNDGIDVDHCQDVRIANCFIESADDCIVIKNTPNFASYGGSARITVTGCTVSSRSSGLKVDETYLSPGARDIVFADCTVTHSNRGLCIQSRDAGDIENVLFANIVVETEYSPHKWWGAAEPIHITLYPRTAQTKLGHVRHIRFSNILCRGEGGVVLQGWPARPLEDIVFDHVRVEIAKTGSSPGGFYDLRPAGLYKGLFDTKIAGIYAHDVRGLSLAHTEVVWGRPADPSYGVGFDRAAVEDLELDHVSLPDSGLQLKN
jgi:polygalacturonase